MNISVSIRALVELVCVVIASIGGAALVLHTSNDSLFGDIARVLYLPLGFFTTALAGGIHNMSVTAGYVALFVAAFITNYVLWFFAKFVWRKFQAAGT